MSLSFQMSSQMDMPSFVPARFRIWGLSAGSK